MSGGVVKSEAGKKGRPQALFLGGDGVPDDPPAQRLFAEATGLFDVCSIELGRVRSRDFAAEVDRVDAVLADADVGVGQSYEAWLLMAAAEQRVVRGDRIPHLLLLNPVLGTAQHLNGSLLGYRAPRSRRVRAAFGLDPVEDGRIELIRRVTYVFGDNDPFSSQSDWSYVRGLGCAVHVVRGWHHLHRHDVEQRLRQILTDYAEETAAGIAAHPVALLADASDEDLRAAGT